MATITNSNITSISKGVYKCPHCKKFFGVKKLSEQEIEMINVAGKCLACIEEEQEEQRMSVEMKNESTEVVTPTHTADSLDDTVSNIDNTSAIDGNVINGTIGVINGTDVINDTNTDEVSSKSNDIDTAQEYIDNDVVNDMEVNDTEVNDTEVLALTDMATPDNIEASDNSQTNNAEGTLDDNVVTFKRDERGKLDTVVIPTNGELIIPGPRGITKHQMLAAISREIDSPENLYTLYKSYPFTYEGSLRYLKSAERQAAKAVIPSLSGENNDKNKLELIQLLKPSRKGVTRHQIIILLERCVMKEDYDVIQQIIKYFPEQFQGSLKYIAKKDYPVIETALEMYLTNDATQDKQLMATA